MAEQRVNFNSLLIALLTIVTGLAGWALAKNYDHMDKQIGEIRAAMMPRHEIELEIANLKSQISHCEEESRARDADAQSRMLQIQTKVDSLELEITKIKRQ